MKLIIDSGGTSTDWCLVDSAGVVERFQTSGLSPVYQSPEEMERVLLSESAIHVPIGKIRSIHFYGAGFFEEQQCMEWRLRLSRLFGADEVEVKSDLWAAARSLCGKNAGIACIIGTGSNSCLYDGTHIVQNISPLGFILGDEGSGAVLGKRILSDVLKNQLPNAVSEQILTSLALSKEEIIDRVYRQPYPNRFLASVARIVVDLQNELSIERIVREEFNRFLVRNVLQYQTASLPIHFTGSVAFVLQRILKEEVKHLGLHVGSITQSPLDGLVKYHINV